MKGKRHTTEEKIRILRDADGGKSIVELCRELQHRELGDRPALGVGVDARVVLGNRLGFMAHDFSRGRVVHAFAFEGAGRGMAQRVKRKRTGLPLSAATFRCLRVGVMRVFLGEPGCGENLLELIRERSGSSFLRDDGVGLGKDRSGGALRCGYLQLTSSDR